MADDLTTMQGCVDAGVLRFASLEQKLPNAQNAAMDLVAIIAAGHGLGMVGALASGQLQAKAKEIAGVIAHAERLTYDLHILLTDIAVAHNVDPPQPLSGGR